MVVQKSASLPALTGKAQFFCQSTLNENISECQPTKKLTSILSLPSTTASNDDPFRVTMKSLMRFIFPPQLCNPESTGRLDLFAHYGPCDEDGNLHGGWNGHHIHTDLEIRHMITELNTEQLYTLLAKPRETVETLVKEMLPKAVRHVYTEKEIHRMFRVISPNDAGRYKFSDMQNLILKDQRRRLLTLIHGGEISKATRRPIPFQTKPGKILTEITTRKKLRPNEEIISLEKRLHGYCGLIAPLEQQNLSNALVANVKILPTNGLGDVNDRWDRYCAIRQTGKVSYVRARNAPRIRFMGDDDLADKAQSCSTMTATKSMNGPRDRKATL